VELLPSSAEAHLALGRFHAAIHHYRDAKEEYDRAAALDTTSAEPYYRLGQAYAEAGETRGAIEALTRALARNPTHAGAQAVLQAVMDKRDTASGLPEGYGALGGRMTLSRGELGVMLAAELGLDLDHPGEMEGDVTEVRGTWGERWLRAAIGRGWLSPFPDGSFHLGDPVTRGALALTLAQIERSLGPLAPPGSSSFPDLSARHYLARAAALAVRMGLPLRSDGRFDPWTSATGTEALLSVKGIAREHGLRAIVPGEPKGAPVVK